MQANGSSRVRRWATLAVAPAVAVALLGGGAAAGVGAQRGDVGTQAIRDDFSNRNRINIRDDQTANPYPSTINVAVPSQRLYDVNVRLFDFAHERPDDVDVMLVGPTGLEAIILSDVGGTNAIGGQGVNLVLDDETAGSMPDSGRLGSGTYKPTNIGGNNDQFPGQGDSNNVALGVFDRTNPNGAWRLYVVDDNGEEVGEFGSGWEIEIYYGEAPEAKDDAYRARTDRTLSVSESRGVLANDNDGDPEPGVDSVLSARLRKDARKGTVRLRADGSFTYKPDDGASGTDSFTYFVQDLDGLRDTGEVKITIRGR